MAGVSSGGTYPAAGVICAEAEPAIAAMRNAPTLSSRVHEWFKSTLLFSGLTAEPQQECLLKLPMRYVTTNSDVLHPCKFRRYGGVNSCQDDALRRGRLTHSDADLNRQLHRGDLHATRRC